MISFQLPSVLPLTGEPSIAIWPGLTKHALPSIAPSTIDHAGLPSSFYHAGLPSSFDHAGFTKQLWPSSSTSCLVYGLNQPWLGLTRLNQMTLNGPTHLHDMHTVGACPTCAASDKATVHLLLLSIIQAIRAHWQIHCLVREIHLCLPDLSPFRSHLNSNCCCQTFEPHKCVVNQAW